MKVHIDDRGWAYNDIFGPLKDGGQVNFSVLFPGIVKAWHRHKFQTDMFCVVMGDARVATHDPQTGKSETYFMGEHNPIVLTIKPGLWHGFTALGDKPCGLIYCMDKQYNPQSPDEERAPFDAFGYNWFPENR